MIILSLKIPPQLQCVATLPCEMSSVLKTTVENKTTALVKLRRKNGAILGHPVYMIVEHVRAFMLTSKKTRRRMTSHALAGRVLVWAQFHIIL